MSNMEITNTSVWGFEHAMRGMRNPMKSWDKADSKYCYEYTSCNDCPLEVESEERCHDGMYTFTVGKNDMKLAQSLIKSGPEHRKFLRMIHVSADINMPRYFFSEMDTYHFNTKNSESTMHRLLNTNEPITKDLFVCSKEDEDILNTIIEYLESMRRDFKMIQDNKEDKDKSKKLNRLLVRAKRLLPEGFLQLRTWDSNYEEIRTMYFQRKNHRLQEEWHDVFCKWVETLPYAKEFILYTGE